MLVGDDERDGEVRAEQGRDEGPRRDAEEPAVVELRRRHGVGRDGLPPATGHQQVEQD